MRLVVLPRLISELLVCSDPPCSVSHSVGITGGSHHAQTAPCPALKKIFNTSSQKGVVGWSVVTVVEVCSQDPQ